MATVNYIKEQKQTVSAMKGVIEYCAQDKKVRDPTTDRRLVSGINCNGEDAFTEFMATKHAYGQTQGFKFFHYDQSFHPEEEVTYAQAHEIALEFAAKAWPGHEVQVCTHCDTDKVHSHFVINAVSFETGKKLRQTPQTLKQLRQLSDGICIAHGLSTLKPYENSGRNISTREYRAAAKGQSWKFRLMADIDAAMQLSGSREDFMYHMKKRGYQLTWTMERKYITFLCPNGMKCRDIKLHDQKYLKGNIEYELRIREQLADLIFSERLSAEELAELGDYGADALSALGICHPGTAVGGMDEAAEAGSRVSTHPVQADLRSDHQGRNAGEAGRGEGSGESSPPESYDGEQNHGDRAEEIYHTGWEGQRGIYVQNLCTGGKEQKRDPRTGFQYAPEHPKAADVDGTGIHSPVGAGLHGLAALGNIIQNDSDDPEEQRKRIQAQQAGADLGAVLGLAIGAAVAAYEHSQEAPMEESVEENHHPKMEGM